MISKSEGCHEVGSTESLKGEATEMSDPLIHQRRDKTKVKRTLDAIRKEGIRP